MAIPEQPGVGFGHREVRRDDHYPWRFWIAPFETLDYIDLPYAIREMRRSRDKIGVEFDCEDGFTYELTGDPDDTDPYRTFTITKARRA